MTATQPQVPTESAVADRGEAPVLALPTAVRPPLAVTVRVLPAAVAGPVLASYAVMVAVVALLSVTAGAPWSLAGAFENGAAFWLAAHQVPLMITVVGGPSAPLGVLPLVPTVGVAWLIARSARAAGERLRLASRADLYLLVGVFAGGEALVGLLLAVASPAQRLTASPPTAILGCAAIGGLAAAVGGLRTEGLARLVVSAVPAWGLCGVRAGLLGLGALLAGGAVATVGGLLVSAGRVGELLSGWEPYAGGQFGIIVLSLGYLPNALVAGLSWIAGPGFAVGAVSVNPFGTGAGALPAVPLLAALPEPGPAPWRVMVFALPLLAAVLVGRACRSFDGPVTDRLHAVAAAGGVAAASCFLLAILAGGRLGEGGFDPVRIPAASLAIAVFVWLTLPAAVIVGLRDRTVVAALGELPVESAPTTDGPTTDEPTTDGPTTDGPTTDEDEQAGDSAHDQDDGDDEQAGAVEPTAEEADEADGPDRADGADGESSADDAR